MKTLNKFILDLSAYFGTEDPRTVLISILGIFVFLTLIAFSLRAGKIRKNAILQIRNLKNRVDGIEGSLIQFQGDLDSRLLEFKSLVDEVKQGIKLIKSGTVSDQSNTESITAPPHIQPEESFELNSNQEVTSERTKVSSGALDSGLKKTRESLFSRIKNFFRERNTIDQAALFELEELLLSSDIGVQCSARIIQRVKDSIADKGGVDIDKLYSELRGELVRVMSFSQEEQYEPLRHGSGTSPRVVLIVGVNGVGKTTTAAKLAKYSKDNGANPIIVAADTFRAAAVEQLIMWGDRLSIPVVSGKPDDKPATVIFDAVEKALSNKNDLIIIDTAGRLHTKSNLMQELEGIRNVLKKKLPDAPHETLLVVDGITGNNALTQAREFNSIAPLTGVIVTKLDGTPKGGIVVAIRDELKLPVRFIGVGEQASDLISFNAEDFVHSIIP